MKSFMTKLVIIILVMGFTMFCSKVLASDWKEFAEANTGIFYYDTSSVRSSPEGFVRVWVHNITKHETFLVEFNCKGRTYKILDFVKYDDSLRIKTRDTYYDNPNWLNIDPKSISEYLYKNVCP